MIRFVLRPWCFLALMILGLAGSAAAQPLVAPTEALSPAEQQAKFHLPPGFEIQLVAAEPAIHKPMNITFDARGRLWVTDTLEYPYPAKEGVTPRDTVKVLADTNGDGVADEVTTFATGLNIPLGVLPVANGAIVYSIPSVKYFRDTDGDGKADSHQELYGNFGSRDTHGMVNSFTRGLDGWLYACHGFHNDSAPVGSDGHQLRMNSGNTFRMRLDGSRVEFHTHGQVNPFGLSFDPLGNLYSADCHTMPIYMLLRGAYYPSFGKPHDGLGFGPTMIAHNHKSTGIGGIAYYAAQHFPKEYHDTIFIGNPVTGCVNHDKFDRHGSTLEAVELPDFVTCDDPWFRPVNLQVGPDGALYIADFYNCIIGHYEVPLEHPRRDRHRGRIWRVIYTGKGVTEAPEVAPLESVDVAGSSFERLLQLLGHANLTVRTLATHEIVDRIGESAAEPLAKLIADEQSSSFAKIHAMWALERIAGVEESLISRLAADSDPGVRVHLMRMLAERTSADVELLRKSLADADPNVRRAAADALGRHPSENNIRPLAGLWKATAKEDTHLVHVARMALRDQLLPSGAYEAASRLAADDAALAQQIANVSLGVPTETSADFVLKYLATTPKSSDREAHLHHAARYMPAERLSEVFAVADYYRSQGLAEQIGVVRALGRGLEERRAERPEALTQWITQLCTQLLSSESEGQVRAGVDLARDFRPPVLDQLKGIAGSESQFARLRPAALDACAAYDPGTAVPVLAAVLKGSTEPVDLRQHAAAALGRINDEAARQELVECLPTAPEGLALAIAAGLADTRSGAESLMAAVTEGKASARLLQEGNVVNRLRARGLEGFEERLSALTANLPPADQRIRELIATRRERFASSQADVAVGAAVFEKHCAVCHRIGDKGAKIGPNLDGVGIRGVDRLLEDVLDPSRNVDQAFRTTQVVTADGQSLSGLALREEGNILVLADAQGKEVRVPLDEIEQRVVNALSVMPANLADQISETDFVHLLGYLLSQRAEQAAK